MENPVHYQSSLKCAHGRHKLNWCRSRPLGGSAVMRFAAHSNGADAHSGGHAIRCTMRVLTHVSRRPDRCERLERDLTSTDVLQREVGRGSLKSKGTLLEKGPDSRRRQHRGASLIHAYLANICPVPPCTPPTPPQTPAPSPNRQEPPMKVNTACLLLNRLARHADTDRPTVPICTLRRTQNWGAGFAAGFTIFSPDALLDL